MKKILSFIILAIFLTVSTIYAIDVVKIASMTYSVKSTTTTVTTSATALPATALAGRESVAIRLNSTSDTVYLGGSDVTTTNGFPLDSSTPSISLDIDDSVVIYGIVSAGTADIRTLEAK